MTYDVALRNSLITAFSTQFNSGTLLLQENGVTRVTLTFPTTFAPAAAGGVITTNPVGNAQIASSTTGPGINGFVMRNSGGTALITMTNTTFTVTPANQNTSTNRLTIASHGLTNGQTIQLSGSLPTSTPQVDANQTLFAKVIDANTIEILTERGGTAIDITAAAAADTIVSYIPLAIGDLNAKAIWRLNQTGVQLNAGDIVSVSSATFQAPLGLQRVTV